MVKHTAHRISSGHYLYRGYAIQSVGYYSPERRVCWEAVDEYGCGFGHSYSLKECKMWVDVEVNREEAKACILQWINALETSYPGIVLRYAYDDGSHFHTVEVSPESIRRGNDGYKQEELRFWEMFLKEHSTQNLLISEPNDINDMHHLIYNTMDKMRVDYEVRDIETCKSSGLKTIDIPYDVVLMGLNPGVDPGFGQRQREYEEKLPKFEAEITKRVNAAVPHNKEKEYVSWRYYTLVFDDKQPKQTNG